MESKKDLNEEDKSPQEEEKELKGQLQGIKDRVAKSGKKEDVLAIIEDSLEGYRLDHDQKELVK
jgi:precorrin-4 methylase